MTVLEHTLMDVHVHTHLLDEEDPDCRIQKRDGTPLLVTALVKVKAEDALDVVKCLG